MEDDSGYFKLIIVDDEERIRRGLSCFGNWEALGFKVAAVYEDGREALDHLHRESVDAILTDIRMSEISGLELAKQVSINFPDTHLVIMSGYKDFDYARQALQYRAFDYLLKPIEINTLAETFEKLKASIQEKKAMLRLKSLVPNMEDLLNQQLNKNSSRIEKTLKEGIHNGVIDMQTEKTQYVQNIVKKVQNFVKENYHKNISLTDVAETVYLSPNYFCRLFKDLTGLNFLAYLTCFRMEKARELLSSHKYMIGEVGRMVGYANTRYFTRVFKKHYGSTPTNFIHKELRDE